MNFKKLQYFIDVVQLKSITKAAEKNNITQCAMSQQIKAIESEFETLLLIRKRNKITTTNAGDIFYNFCLESLDYHEMIVKEINTINKSSICLNT